MYYVVCGVCMEFVLLCMDVIHGVVWVEHVHGMCVWNTWCVIVQSLIFVFQRKSDIWVIYGKFLKTENTPWCCDIASPPSPWTVTSLGMGVICKMRPSGGPGLM